MRACMQCVSIKPEWAKGYSRLGAAYFGLGQLDEAIQAYKDGEADWEGEGLIVAECSG